MMKRNPFVLALCALMIVVVGYAFWINVAH
jgi:hypothetical protein